MSKRMSDVLTQEEYAGMIHPFCEAEKSLLLAHDAALRSEIERLNGELKKAGKYASPVYQEEFQKAGMEAAQEEIERRVKAEAEIERLAKDLASALGNRWTVVEILRIEEEASALAKEFGAETYQDIVKNLTAEIERLKRMEAEHQNCYFGNPISEMRAEKLAAGERYRAEIDALLTEIERLKAERDAANFAFEQEQEKHRATAKQRSTAEAERDVLRSEAKVVDEWLRDSRREVVELKADNARLRAALERIATYDAEGWPAIADGRLRIAREALEGKP